MSYAGLQSATDPNAPHLGGNIRGGDPHTWCPKVWDYVVDRFGVTSVLDFGSGSGTTALYLHRRGLQVCAVDGLDENLAASVFPTIKHDVTQGPFISRFDLIHCQEVVEHIEAASVPHLLQSFSGAKFVLMTHALPGQQGFHHVNLQADDYWIGQMATEGFSLLQEDTDRIRRIAASERSVYMAQSGLMFANSKRLA